MRKDYEKLFATLSPPELPEGLFDRVMKGIQKEKKLMILKRRIALFSIGFVGSFVAFFPTFKTLETNIYSSGFMQFSSLIFSDFKIIITYWQNFAMTLLETLPAINLAGFLTVLFVFFISLRFLTRDIWSLYTIQNYQINNI